RPTPGIEQAIEYWYNNCIGAPIEVDGSPLTYEPRAAWSCSACHSILIGTKSGDLYRLENNHVEQVCDFPGASVQALHGCLNPDCSNYSSDGQRYQAVI